MGRLINGGVDPSANYETIFLQMQPWELGKKYDDNFNFIFAFAKVRYGGITTAKIFKHGNYQKQLLLFCFLLLDCYIESL